MTLLPNLMATGPLLLLLASGCGGPAQPQQTSASSALPTFHADLAPLVYAKCTPCHRPGEAAPFPLTNYEEVKRRARQIGIVTASRFMPPWLPAPGELVFANDRSLAPEEIDLFQRWVAAGAPEGDPADGPDPPRWPTGWNLGEPDVEVSMPDTFYVPAEGRDVYRNFVIRSPVDRPTWIRTVEFQPDNRVVLHHAVLFVDGTGTARSLDELDPLPGYDGMDVGHLKIPDGQFVTWLPGKVPSPGTDDIAFRLEPHTDLVLQLHLRPSGKREPIQVALGLFEATGPPSRHPMTIRLWSREIDIPPGEPAYLVEASYTLPVDLQVLAVYPHAHYLGDDLQGFAHLPDGTTRRLIHIPAWDFNWQEEYFYEEPLSLPAGTTLAIRYTFDNTEENPLNPNSPPRRVVHGFQSSDEMAELLLSVLPREEDRPVLWNHFVRFAREVDLENVLRHAAEEPEQPGWHHEIGTYCLRLGRTAEAVRQYAALVAKAPDRANPLQRLGRARLADGDAEGAVRDLRAALELDPFHIRARVTLGQALQQLGREDEARRQFEEVLAVQPGQWSALTHLAEIRRANGELERAAELFRAALSSNPESLRALAGLSLLELERGRTSEALALADRALHVQPDDAGAHYALGLALAARGERAEALWHLELAVRFRPEELEFAHGLDRIRNAPADR